MLTLNGASETIVSKTTLSVLLAHVAAYSLFLVLWPPDFAASILALGAVFIWISMVDFRTFEIPDMGWILVLALGLSNQAYIDRLPEAVLTALIWPLAVFVLIALHAKLRGSVGFGFGDIKLLAGIGAWSGLEGTIWVLLAASLAGIAAILSLTLVRGNSLQGSASNMIAFGPFLCFSCWAIVLQEGRF
jgi:leader peptidase (prepilin peptidase)/N-methyltransferase